MFLDSQDELSCLLSYKYVESPKDDGLLHLPECCFLKLEIKTLIKLVFHLR